MDSEASIGNLVPTLILQGPAPLSVYSVFPLVGASSYILGRSAQCDFVVADSSISRRHAEVRAVNGEIEVCDLGSRNGTWVDDVGISHCTVRHGQHIRFGRILFLAHLCQQEKKNMGSEEETDACDESRPISIFENLGLTTSQRRVLELLLQGLGEKRIAACLELSPHTVHNHARAIYRIMRVHSRPELLALLLRKPGDMGETLS